MRPLVRWVCLLLLGLSGLVGVAWGGTTGKLSGVVSDDKGAPLAGVNVRIEQLRLGAVSDDQGRYFMIGATAGRYQVKANLLGYAAFVADNVDILPDFTTELNIALKTEAVQLGEVKVEAERPLLQRDATSTARFIPGDEIQRLPTRGYKEAAAQQAGIVNFQRLIDRESYSSNTLIVRGGRPNETAFYVDGFSQQDPLTGYSTTAVNSNAIQEVVVLNGGFNAEYGRIMSGVVNVITKEGGQRLGGAVEGVTDNFGTDPPGSKFYDYNLYDLNLGGPIFPNKSWGSFYASGQRRWQRDRSPSAIVDGPLPANSLGGWTGQGKLTIPFGDRLNLRLGALGSRDDWREFRNSYRYDLIHIPRYRDDNRSVTGQLSHTLAKSTFYTVGGSWFLTERKRGDGVFFDDMERYAAYDPYQPDLVEGIPWFRPGVSDTNSALGRILAQQALDQGGDGYVFPGYLRRKSSYWAIKGDLTSQLNPFHQLKSGVQYDRHTLRYYNHLDPFNFPTSPDIERYGFSADGRKEEDSGRDGARHPYSGSIYAQDKYERAGLVVNAGLRWDYINTNVPALKDENLPLGTDGQLQNEDLVENKTYSRISPRVGIGFPVSENTVMHANWGHFIQQPNLQDLYASYAFLERVVNRGGYFVTFGNPNLKPEKTTAYEVGIAHRMSEYAKVDATLYYKDVKDLVQVVSIPSAPYGFASYRNVDFATIKGLDLAVTMRRFAHVTAAVNYSLSFANGTGSVSNTRSNFAWQGDVNIPKQTAPLDFDQRHKLSLNLDYLLGSEEGPTWNGAHLFGNVNVNVLYNVASGTPYTPTTVYDEVTLGASSGTPIGPVNSRYGPWTQSLDFKAGKSFGWSGLNMNAFVWVLNLLDTDNAVSVFNSTGSPDNTGYLNGEEGRAIAENIRNVYGLDPNDVYAQALRLPARYTNPRMVRFGLRVGF